MSSRDDQGTGTTSGSPAAASVGKLTYLRRIAVHMVVKVLPDPWVDRLRRRRARKRFLNVLGYELVQRDVHLEDLEQGVSARRDGFYQGIVKDVLERTEVVLQELDRHIEGLSARTGERLSAVEEQMVQLREELGRLRRLSDPQPTSAEAGPSDAIEGPEAPERAATEPAAGPDAHGGDAMPPGTSGNGRVSAAEHAATTAD